MHTATSGVFINGASEGDISGESRLLGGLVAAPCRTMGKFTGESFDHAMWFYEPPRFDSWLLCTMHNPVANAGRGLALGASIINKGAAS